jgi:nucleotide-binding universal stress UspA family protein
MADDRIVVGVDGSDGGRRALRWALHEAAARGRTVQAVIAWRWDTPAPDLPPREWDHPEEEHARAEQVLADELAALGAGAVGGGVVGGGVVVAAEAVEGRAADVLCAAARDADLLVLGSHGHGRIRHTVLGSVSEECVRNAPCPVVVIPVPQQQPSRTTEPATTT